MSVNENSQSMKQAYEPERIKIEKIVKFIWYNTETLKITDRYTDFILNMYMRNEESTEQFLDEVIERFEKSLNKNHVTFDLIYKLDEKP